MSRSYRVSLPSSFLLYGLACCLGTEPIRGDGNGDGRVDLSDATFSLRFQFLARPPVVTCLSALDVNGDTFLDLTDPIAALTHLYFGSPSIPAPYPSCGQESLDRERALPCQATSSACFLAPQPPFDR